jgi:hypothetical protein
MKRKFCINIILILIIILCFILYNNGSVNIANILNETKVQTKKEDNLSKLQDNSYLCNVNLPSNIINGSYIVYDENYIYYINHADSNNLYKIDMNGKKSELLYNGDVSRLYIKDNNILFINKINDDKELYSIEKDGRNLKKILADKEILNYSVFENTIYYIAPDGKQADYIIPYKIHNLYSYDITESKINLVFENVACYMNSPVVSPVIINDKKVYFGIFNLNSGILEYEYLKYDIESRADSILSKLSPQAISDNTKFFSYENDSDVQCIYSMQNDDAGTLKTIYKNDDIRNSIMKMAASEHYLFVMIIDDIYNENPNLKIVRMKHDGSDIVKIAQMDLPSFGSYFPNCMQVVENKLIIYKYDENWNPSIIVMDFQGNTFDWDI